MKRLHKSLVLAAALFGAGGGSAAYLYFGRIQNRAEREEAKRDKLKMFRFERDEVEGGIIHARGATIAFARDPEHGWRLTSPVETPADAAAVDNALDRMRDLVAEAVDTGEVTSEVLARYELSKPKIWMEVTTKNGPYTLIVGPKNIDERRFVTDAARKTIRLADGAFVWALDRGLESFRESRVFPVSPKAVREIFVAEGGKTKFVLSRARDDGPFAVSDGTSPPAPADAGDANLILVALTSRLKADRWIDGLPSEEPAALAEMGMKHFDLEIEVKTEKEDLRLLLGFLRETSAARVVSIAHVVGTRSVAVVPDWIRKDIDKPAADLEDKSIARFDRDKAERIEISFGVEAVLIERKPGEKEAWTVGQKKEPGATWKIAPLLLTLSRFRAERWIAESPPPSQLEKWALSPPAHRVRVLDGSGAVLADVSVGGSIDGQNVAVMAAGSKRIAAHSKRILDLLPSRASDLVSR